MHNERGLQNKASDTSRQLWEGGEFPMLCESCLGDNPYLRMQKHTYGGSCKMCDRPFTIFRWRPGRGEGYRKTEVCQTCSKVKNLRDAVLSQTDGTLVVPESDANREYFAAQHLALVASGNDPWQSGETPNEKLLKLARGIAADREQSRVKLSTVAGKRQHSDLSYARTAGTPAEDDGTTGNDASDDDDKGDENAILPPPGMTVEDMKAAGLVEGEAAAAKAKPVSAAPAKPKPPKPPGPPPEWAFKKCRVESS